MGKEKRKRDTKDVIKSDLESAWKAYRENAIVRNCVNEFVTHLSRSHLVVRKQSEKCSDFLLAHIEDKIKPFLYDCMRNLLIQGYVTYNIVPAYKSKLNLPYPVLVHFDDCCTRINKTEYAEVKIESFLTAEVSEREPKIETFVAQAPYSDGGINSSVFAAAKYARHSSFLYESEMKRIQRASTSTYLIRKCKQSKEPDLDKIMNPGDQQQTEVDESQLDSLTKALNANLNRPVQTQQTADGVSFFTLPEDTEAAIPVAAADVKMDLIKIQEHLTCMMCHAMQVPVDMLVHDVTHQTDARILNSRKKFDEKASRLQAHIVTIAYRVFFLCFEKFDEDRFGEKLLIHFETQEDSTDEANIKAEVEENPLNPLSDLDVPS